jgi:uncharacterized protein (TIGR01777 family)
MRALVTGATGFIGRHLVATLERPVVLSRDPDEARRLLGDVEAYAWQPEAGPPAPAALDGVDVIFHLAGESISGRWSERKKRAIRESRVAGTHHLVAGLAACAKRPRALISASAIGFYGDRGDEVLDEESATGRDFLAEVCRAWEDEAGRARSLGMRVACVRTGIVLGADGGALERMLGPFRLGLGGRLGRGDQWMSWIHLDDELGLLRHAAARDEIDGPLNVVSPTPVRNVDFTTALAFALGRPAILPAPRFALRLAFGELADALLASQRVMPRVAERTGYRFLHPTLDGALVDLLGPGPRPPEAHEHEARP